VVQRVQCGAKAKNVTPKRRAMGARHARRRRWTWTALDADTKVILSWRVDSRDADSARVLMDDLSGRLAHKVQFATDGHTADLRAVDEAFGAGGKPSITTFNYVNEGRPAAG
jgi:IS1 family transposase